MRKSFVLLAIILGAVGFIVAGPTLGQEDPVSIIKWNHWDVNDVGTAKDPGLKWSAPDSKYRYLTYGYDVASATILGTDNEVTVGFDNVYPMYSPLVSLGFAYTGDYTVLVNQVIFTFMDDVGVVTSVNGFNVGGMELVAGWIEGSSGILYGVSKDVYLDMPYPVTEQGVGDLCVPKLIGEIQALRLVDGDSYKVHLLVSFTEDLLTEDAFSFSVDLEWVDLES